MVTRGSWKVKPMGMLNASHLDTAFLVECGDRAYAWWWLECDKNMRLWYR